MVDSAVSLPKMSLNNMIFSYMKEYIDNILPYDECRSYSEDPHTDVDRLAKSIGIKILYTSFSETPETIAAKFNIRKIINLTKEFQINEHAFLTEINGEYIIFVNDRKNIEEQRFSIAHEVEHYISKKSNKPNSNYIPSFLLAKAIACIYLSSSLKINNRAAPELKLLPNIVIVKALIEHLPKKDDAIKRRSDYISQLKKLEKDRHGVNELITSWKAGIVSKYIASDMSFLLNKRVSDKKTRAVFQKHLRQVGKKMSLKVALFNIIVEIIEEEIADYFAANLLVPTELLTMWEDKSNNKIAKAFKVSLKCIKRRRRYEIEHELNHITSEYLSSHREAETSAPIPNEITHSVGGYSIHDAGQC